MEPLAAVTRNGYIESVHYGYICIVDQTGKILYSLGDYKTRIFFRSSAKPIQIIPFIQSGAWEAFKFTLKEIAIACSSHSGQKIHQATVSEILNRLDLGAGTLQCGLMNPYNEEENKRLMQEKQSPNVLHCSCSGKHSAMLALAKYKGYPLEGYEHMNHPVQQDILSAISCFTDEEESAIPTGIDGCGVPIYLLPIHKIALSYSRLVKYSQQESSEFHKSCKAVYDAMTQYPELVSGEKEFCTELMQNTGCKLIGKVGCEAVYCIGVKQQNLGICIKITDGNERAVYPVAIHVLKELGVLDHFELEKLNSWHKPVLLNNLNQPIGKIVPIFTLGKAPIDHNPLGKLLDDSY